MATSIAFRSSSSLRSIFRISTTNSTVSIPSVSSIFVRRRISISPHPMRLLRRELSSLLPIHSAIASACLVSKLPAETSASIEGRFANYLSPI